MPIRAALIAALLTLTAPAVAVAQTDAVTAAEANAVLSSSSSSTTTTIVGGIILTVVLSRDSSALERYLRDNAVALREEIGHGAGDTVDDLSHIFGVVEENQDRFGRMLRRHRRPILELIDPARLDEVRTKRFVELVIRRCVEEGVYPATG